MAEWIHKGFQSERLKDHDPYRTTYEIDFYLDDDEFRELDEEFRELRERPELMGLWTSEVDDNFRSNFFISIQHQCKRSRTLVTERSLYFALLRQWLEECDISHPCNPKAQFWPTRIIFVGDSDSTELELWETESKKAQLSDANGYIALSHCWGRPTKTEKEQFCTTRENYRRRLKGFTMDDLPKTFKDAVQVTRALGKQFLWIDALCIIQAIEHADDSDWKIEASRMEQVFGSADCTVAASSAEGWTNGFIKWKSTPRFDQDTFERSTNVCTNTADYTKDVDAARLNQRAWVLQERLLSHRTIHFTESHTYWECGHEVRCENFIKLNCPPGREHFLIDPEFPTRLQDSGYTRTIDFIQFLFEKYAQSGLTEKSDRVVAISGLVRRMEGAFRTGCRYGVFEAFLFRLLLWRRCNQTDVNERHFQDQHLPSWSWMTYSRIHFLSIDHDLDVPAKCDLRFDTKRERVLLVQVRVFQDCTMGRKESGYIILDEDSKDIGVLFFDMPTHIHFQYCVVIGMVQTRIHVEDSEKTYHVLLVRKTPLENQHERVGLGEVKARCVSKDFCEGELC